MGSVGGYDPIQYPWSSPWAEVWTKQDGSDGRRLQTTQDYQQLRANWAENVHFGNKRLEAPTDISDLQVGEMHTEMLYDTDCGGRKGGGLEGRGLRPKCFSGRGCAVCVAAYFLPTRSHSTYLIYSIPSKLQTTSIVVRNNADPYADAQSVPNTINTWYKGNFYGVQHDIQSVWKLCQHSVKFMIVSMRRAGCYLLL